MLGGTAAILYPEVRMKPEAYIQSVVFFFFLNRTQVSNGVSE